MTIKNLIKKNMGRRCVLLNCPSSDHQILYQFPDKGDNRRDKWIEFIKVATGLDFIPKVSSKICQNHFETELFVGKCLKPFAIPTIVCTQNDEKSSKETLEETLYNLTKSRPNWHYQRQGVEFLLFQLHSQTVPQIAHSIKLSLDQNLKCYSQDRIINLVVPASGSLIEKLATVCEYLENQVYKQDLVEIDLLHPLSREKVEANVHDYLIQKEGICRFCGTREIESRTGRLKFISHEAKESYQKLVQEELNCSPRLSDRICEPCLKLLNEASRVQTAVIAAENRLIDICERFLTISYECLSSFEEEKEIENVETEVVIETEVLEDQDDSATMIEDSNYVESIKEDEALQEFIEIGEHVQEDFETEISNDDLDGYLITIDEGGKRHFQCTKCKKEFAKKYSLDHHFKHSSAHSNAGSTADSKCDECSSSFYDFTTLKRHKAMVHDLQKTPCTICNKEFNAYHMNLHLKRHQKSKFSCPCCPKRFYENNYLLQEHIKAQHSNEKIYECEYCKEFFATKFNLLKHLNNSHPEVPKPFLCTNCGVKLWSKQALSSHHRKCLNGQGDKPRARNRKKAVVASKFGCQSCSSTFKTKAALVEHEERHLNQEVHICNFCNKSFTRERALRIHVQSIHLKEFQCFCLHCNKGFVNASGLRQHVQIHENERQFQCKICRKGFNRCHTLNVHIKAMHRNRRYRCKWCLENGYVKDIKKLDTFMNHIKTMHEIESQNENLEEQIIEDDITELLIQS